MVMLGCKGLNCLSRDMKYRMCNNDFNRFVRNRIPLVERRNSLNDFYQAIMIENVIDLKC